jgi:hypothetical protein
MEGAVGNDKEGEGEMNRKIILYSIAVLFTEGLGCLPAHADMDIIHDNFGPGDTCRARARPRSPDPPG